MNLKWAAPVGLLLCLGTTTSFASEPTTSAQLRQDAITFNHNYSKNNVGPVYDMWDAASQKLISRAEYIYRHQLCPTNPGPAIIREITPGANKFWQVHYLIDQAKLVDYWRYQNGHWRFDLFKSNPEAVVLYKLNRKQYEKAVGCWP
jgi:hypothetical protein